MFGGLELKYYFCNVNHKSRFAQKHKSIKTQMCVYVFMT